MMKKNNLSCCSTSKSPVIDDRVTDKKVWALWYNSNRIELDKNSLKYNVKWVLIYQNL